MANLVENVQTWLGFPTKQNIEGFVESRVQKIVSEIAIDLENEYLRESYDHVTRSILQFDEEGWTSLTGYRSDSGFTLQDIKQISSHSRRVTKDNPLLVRGLELRNNYVFGRGFVFEHPGVTTNTDGTLRAGLLKTVLDNPINQQLLFSNTAMKRANKTLYETGNFFIIFNRVEKEFQRLSIDNIENAITYNEDNTRVKYYLRAYTPSTTLSELSNQVVYEWIPTDEYLAIMKSKGRKLPSSLELPQGYPTSRARVRSDLVIFEHKANLADGQLWGTPDNLAAIPWAWAASQYLKNGSGLLEALYQIAYHVKTKTEKGGRNLGAKISSMRTADALITGKDVELSQMPRASAVDLYTGRPIQAMAASALGVSVAALTSDTAMGGSYASEQTLSLPEQLAALSRQEDWTDFYRRIFTFLGSPSSTINFKRLSLDTPWRVAQMIELGFIGGLLQQVEARAAYMELMDISGDPNDLPEPNLFTGSKASTLPEFIKAMNTGDAADSTGDPIARQGNSGAVGSTTPNNSAAQDTNN